MKLVQYLKPRKEISRAISFLVLIKIFQQLFLLLVNETKVLCQEEEFCQLFLVYF